MRHQPAHEALANWLNEEASGLHRYALVDMAALPMDLNHAACLERLTSAGAVPVLRDARPQAQCAIPWLLPWQHGRAQRSMLNDTVDWALRGPCVTWLSSPLAAPALADRLEKRTQAELPERHAILLRCYDPRVLPEIQRALRPDQAETYWALGAEWHYLDRTQALQCLALKRPLPADPFEAPLRLDQAQFTALLDASEIDSIMPELAREAPDAFLALPAAQRATATRRYLRLADNWQVHTFAQRVMVGVLALRLGEDFHEHPAWAPWIADLKLGKMGLIEVIERATAS